MPVYIIAAMAVFLTLRAWEASFRHPYTRKVCFAAVTSIFLCTGCTGQPPGVADWMKWHPEFMRGSQQAGHATVDAPHAPKNETKLDK